jgi:hypothetical protein
VENEGLHCLRIFSSEIQMDKFKTSRIYYNSSAQKCRFQNLPCINNITPSFLDKRIEREIKALKKQKAEQKTIEIQSKLNNAFLYGYPLLNCQEYQQHWSTSTIPKKLDDRKTNLPPHPPKKLKVPLSKISNLNRKEKFDILSVIGETKSDKVSSLETIRIQKLKQNMKNCYLKNSTNLPYDKNHAILHHKSIPNNLCMGNPSYHHRLKHQEREFDVIYQNISQACSLKRIGQRSFRNYIDMEKKLASQEAKRAAEILKKKSLEIIFCTNETIEPIQSSKKEANPGLDQLDSAATLFPDVSTNTEIDRAGSTDSVELNHMIHSFTGKRVFDAHAVISYLIQSLSFVLTPCKNTHYEIESTIPVTRF